MTRRAVLRLAIIASVLGACEAGGSGGGGKVEIGAPVPDYAAVSLDGDSVSLAKEAGKVLLLNIWATWCHPCRAEIPELRALQAQYHPRGFDVVGVSINVDGAGDQIRDFMQEFEMQYPVWLDPADRVSNRFLAVGVPASYLIDREGVLRWRKIGPIAPGDTSLTGAIERALQ